MIKWFKRLLVADAIVQEIELRVGVDRLLIGDGKEGQIVYPCKVDKWKKLWESR